MEKNKNFYCRWILDYLSFTTGIRAPPEKTHNTSTQTENYNGDNNKTHDTATQTENYNGDNNNVGIILRRISRSVSMSSEEAIQLELAIQRLGIPYNGDNKKNNGDNGYTFQEEWRVVAMTIDRILFIASIVIFIVGTIGCFARTKYVK